MWQKVKHTIKDKIIKALVKSRRPVSELAMTNAVGLFWTLTPLVGLQMSLVLINWFLFRLVGIKFHLPIALAWVWLSNPLSMPFLYFGFYICGFFLLQGLGESTDSVSFMDFSKALEDTGQMGFWEGSLHWLTYIYEALFWPMCLGSLIIAVPITILAYALSVHLINRHRKKKARSMGISIEQWEKQYVGSDPSQD